jgi:hypothetical protein
MKKKNNTVKSNGSIAAYYNAMGLHPSVGDGAVRALAKLFRIRPDADRDKKDGQIGRA